MLSTLALQAPLLSSEEFWFHSGVIRNSFIDKTWSCFPGRSKGCGNFNPRDSNVDRPWWGSRSSVFLHISQTFSNTYLLKIGLNSWWSLLFVAIQQFCSLFSLWRSELHHFPPQGPSSPPITLFRPVSASLHAVCLIFQPWARRPVFSTCWRLISRRRISRFVLPNQSRETQGEGGGSASPSGVRARCEWGQG